MKAKFIYEVMGDVLKGKSEKEIMSSLENINLKPDELLIKSAKGGFLIGVKKAIEIGADVHAHDDYALREASEKGHYDVVKFLLKNSANAKDDLALRVASENGHKYVVELLLNYGAASQNGHLDVVELLKKYM